MDELKKLIDGSKFEKYFDDICEQFGIEFPNDKLEDLQHIHSHKDKHDPRITFKLGERIICCTINEDDVWRTVTEYTLTPEGCFLIGNPDEGGTEPPSIYKEGNGVSYKLYPFEQGQQLTLTDLGFIDDVVFCGHSLDGKEISMDNLLHNKQSWGSLSKLSIRIVNDHQTYGQIYIICKDGIEFAGIHTHSYSYQEGDCWTNVYLREHVDTASKSIIIENDGDVSSIVVINFSASILSQ